MHATKTGIRRWETATRFYEARVVSDLFGNVVLEKIWGSRYNHRGGHQVVAVGAADCQKGLIQIEKERARRGYQEICVG